VQQEPEFSRGGEGRRDRKEHDRPFSTIDGQSAHPLATALWDAGAASRVIRAPIFRRAAFDRAAEEIGMPGLHPHELRHTAASLAIAAGADVKVVQKMLGHKSATMTLDQYGHLFDDRLDDIADRLDAAASAYVISSSSRTPDNIRLVHDMQ
jgi:integrase